MNETTNLNHGICGTEGQSQRKLVRQQSFVECKVAVSLDVDVVEVKTKEWQPEWQRLVMNRFPRSDVCEVREVVVVHQLSSVLLQFSCHLDLNVHPSLR